jgi:hypothetical protein
MLESDARWLKPLVSFVIIGGIALVLGTLVLIWALVQRGPKGQGGFAGMPPAVRSLPPDARIDSMDLDGDRLAAAGRDGEGAFILVIDLGSGAVTSLLRPSAP